MDLKNQIKTLPSLKLLYSLCRDIKMLGMMTESDRHYITRKFEKLLGYKPNLENPKTFQEKLQWIKLHDRKPIYHNMVDKAESKVFITNVLGGGGVVFQL